MPRSIAFATFISVIAAIPIHSQTLFPNSVVSNDLDFIREDDLHFGYCLQYKSTGPAEMPDKRNDVLFAEDVRVYAASFANGETVEFWVHPDFGDEDVTDTIIGPVSQAVARLPVQMRSLLNHVVIHKGNETAFAEDLGRFFVLYSENIASRISTQDISETVFHESVHATIDVPHKLSARWAAAQQADGQFITEYAKENPDGEDMAESALFAWTLLKHPDRLPKEIEAQVRAIMPHRLAYFENLFRDWALPNQSETAPPC